MVWKLDRLGRNTLRCMLCCRRSLRRLGVLLRALGEYVHGADPNLWEKARDVLVALNPNPDKDIAKMSGRTNALVDLIIMLDGECAAWLETIDTTLAGAFWKVVRLTQDRVDAGMESRLQLAWLHRGTVIRGN